MNDKLHMFEKSVKILMNFPTFVFLLKVKSKYFVKTKEIFFVNICTPLSPFQNFLALKFVLDICVYLSSKLK